MTATEWVVVAGAATLIVWVNWYFLGTAGPAVVATAPADGHAAAAEVAASEIVIVVDGGYRPNAVRARAGVPTRLVFDRRDDSACSEEVVIPDFGVRRFLPTGERTTIEITPATPGRYPFTCGMSMLRGTIVVDA